MTTAIINNINKNTPNFLTNYCLELIGYISPEMEWMIYNMKVSITSVSIRSLSITNKKFI